MRSFGFYWRKRTTCALALPLKCMTIKCAHKQTGASERIYSNYSPLTRRARRQAVGMGVVPGGRRVAGWPGGGQTANRLDRLATCDMPLGSARVTKRAHSGAMRVVHLNIFRSLLKILDVFPQFRAGNAIPNIHSETQCNDCCSIYYAL